MTFRSSVSVAAIAVFLTACAGRPAPVTAPAPANVPAASAPAPAPPAPAIFKLKALTEAPPDWHRLSPDADGVFGTGSERAIRELLSSRTPQRKVIVAVIDGGVDTAHALLKANLWHNTKESANGKDDDGNGLIDDVFGWNYVGGSDLKSVNFETLEVTRLLAACSGLPAGAGLVKPDAAKCETLKGEYARKKREAAEQVGQVRGLVSTEQQVVAVLKEALNGATLTRAKVQALSPRNDEVRQARSMYLQLDDAGFTGKALEATRAEIEGALTFGFDMNSTVRNVVGDDVANLSQKVYGNRDVTGPDAKHGTHVAGIIGAARGSGPVQGIAPNVQIMAVRAVPNGDERDKDVANAIRYAADNGAQIINMSFGKSFSPGKPAVDDAVKYAESKGILFVHAAGNDGEDIDESPSFPSAFAGNARIATNWIEVGASSWKGLDELAAEFSNYGHTHVDLFAPGVDILSSVPGGGTERLSGTSMAAPVVSGVAALLMSYFPTLNASDVKDILLKTARPVTSSVAQPGGSSKVPFATLSQTGAVVDAYAAVKLALTRAGTMKQ